VSLFSSKFDYALAHPDQQILSADEQAGWDLFLGAKCIKGSARRVLTLTRFHSSAAFTPRSYLSEASVHEQFRPGDVAAVVGCEKYHSPRYFLRLCHPAEWNGI
jgi:hypothetical protein